MLIGVLRRDPPTVLGAHFRSTVASAPSRERGERLCSPVPRLPPQDEEREQKEAAKRVAAASGGANAASAAASASTPAAAPVARVATLPTRDTAATPIAPGGADGVGGAREAEVAEAASAEEEEAEPSGEQMLETLASSGEAGRALLEIELSRPLTRKLLLDDAAAIAFLRQHSGAQLSVHKHTGGAATLVATGPVLALQAVSGALRRLLVEPAVEGAGEGEDEYLLTYPPRDARRLLASMELPTLCLRFGVRQRTSTGE